MDLKGSTSTAEALGHERYSELLQECYGDLTEVVLQYQAAIYQYIGDEVVLSWRFAGHPESMGAGVHAFFAYQAVIEGKREEYESRFGTTPVFRGASTPDR